MRNLNKRGAADWTLRKVVALILGVIILILLIFGIVSGKLVPLYESVTGRIDSVLIMFGLMDDVNIVGNKNCVSYSVVDKEGGGELLKEIAINGGVEYRICRDNSCRLFFAVNGQEYSYKSDGTFITRLDGESSWIDESSAIMSEKAKQSDFIYWKIYNEGLDGVYKILGVNDFDDFVMKYSNGERGEIVLYNVVEGFNSKVVLRWRYDVPGWRYYVEEVRQEEEDYKAFQKFYAMVSTGDQDEVYYYDYYGNSESDVKSIDVLIGGNNELETEDELSDLYDKMVKMQNEMKVKVMNGTTSKLKEKLDGKELKFGDGSIWKVSVEKYSRNLPMIILVGEGGKQYGFRFEAFDLRGYIRSDSFALGTINEKKGWNKVGDPEMYRLGDEDYYDASFSLKVYNFLKENCDNR